MSAYHSRPTARKSVRTPAYSSARTLSDGAGMIIARPRRSSRHPNETTVSSRDGMASTRRGGRRIEAQCRGDRRESRDETPGLWGRVVNPSVSPAGTGHNYSRSSLSAEGTAGNSPGIHSWGSGARADMRSPESRRDGGGCTGWMFRRPYGTRGPGSPSKAVRARPRIRADLPRKRGSLSCTFHSRDRLQKHRESGERASSVWFYFLFFRCFAV